MIFSIFKLFILSQENYHNGSSINLFQGLLPKTFHQTVCVRSTFLNGNSLKRLNMLAFYHINKCIFWRCCCPSTGFFFKPYILTALSYADSVIVTLGWSSLIELRHQNDCKDHFKWELQSIVLKIWKSVGSRMGLSKIAIMFYARILLRIGTL